MAKQESFIKLRGKMGDLSFYKHRRSGYQARMKGGVDSQRIASDPAFQRTRENNAEFGRAASTSKKIRQQLSNLLFYYGDSTLSNRLNSRIHQIQKADTVNPRGQRTFLQEHAGMLKGFQMREKTHLSGIFGEELETSYERSTGDAQLLISPFNPQSSVTLLPGATHIQFVLAAAELDIESEFSPKPEFIESSYIPLIGNFSGTNLLVNLNAQPENAVYLIAGIGFYQEVNGAYYPLQNGQFNAMTIVEVYPGS